MHQANMNLTLPPRGSPRFNLVSWETPSDPARGNHGGPPPAAIARQPLSRDAQRRIFAQYCGGQSIEALAKRFRRGRACISRLVETMRAERIMELPLDHVPNRHFPRILRTKAAQKAVLGPPPPGESHPHSGAPKGVPAYLASLYEVPLLTRMQEWHLFRKMNYLKYKADRLRRTLNPLRPKRALMDQIEHCHAEAMTTRNQIIRANLRLVVSVAKRCLGQRDAFFELVSDGNMSLMRAVEKFDFALGNAFATYATWAIIHGFARATLTEYHRRERFRTNHDETILAAADHRHVPGQAPDPASESAELAAILKGLERRELEIIVRRFGLRHGSEPLTLAEIGSEVGVTKERVRHLESRALQKLRWRAVAAQMECPV
jgi:RNA polymerase primary sigma factor/RNA polymerase sigma factor